MIETEPRTLDEYRRKVATLESELDELRRQIERLESDGEDAPPRTGFAAALAAAEGTDARSNLYVYEDDDEEARAFDAFYHAYDGKHAKTRRFLLG